MNGIHDVGAADGFGPVVIESDEPLWHADWERTTFTFLHLIKQAGYYNLDQFRAAIERMPPAAYLTTPYYVHWMHAFEEYLTQGDAAFAEELDRRTAEFLSTPDAPMPAFPGDGEALANELHAFYLRGDGAARPSTTPARFAVGDRVLVSPSVTPHHTRKPGYIRGIVGEVTACWGAYAFPDTNVLGEGESPQHMVTVRFNAVELYGEEFADPTVDVYVDLWEPYLSAADAGKPARS